MRKPLHFSSVSKSTPSRSATHVPTTARLSLGRKGASIDTHEHLRFQLDHALARDAVHSELDTTLVLNGLRERNLEAIVLHSAAPDRRTYLRRPDLGRTLDPTSIAALRHAVTSTEARRSGTTPVFETSTPANTTPNVVFILADGLSPLAVERHALPLLDATFALLIPNPCPLIPLVQNARVAIGDQIGHLLNASLTVVLIGERPGLSAPDSLGVYLTWNPRSGRTDAERNCISNIRGNEGLSYAEAAHRIAHYITEANRLHTTGIALKDPSSTPRLAH
jgi:ethanolamine ammonia-lyase small subunit